MALCCMYNVLTTLEGENSRHFTGRRLLFWSPVVGDADWGVAMGPSIHAHAGVHHC